MQRTRRPSFRLQRLARSGFARLFAHAMALLLVLANFSAWAMPVSHVAQEPAAHAMAQDSTHHHCDEAAAQADAGKDKAAHGKGCPCCMGGACACLHSCSAALATGFPDLASAPAASVPKLIDTVFFDAAGERRLRPPIV